MKITDFAPRTGAMEAFLGGFNLTGIEVGVDVGAHSQSILENCSIRKLYLCDIWLNPYCEGYCKGRLTEYHHRIELMKGTSNEIVKKFGVCSLDFVYLDQQHDYNSVKEDLVNWWAILREGGLMALRNYADSNEGLKRAADEFAKGKKIVIEQYCGEIIFFK